VKYFGLVFTLLLCPSILLGCATVKETGATVRIPPSGKVKAKDREHGPPPHAPAHGYRHKHPHGVELEFDSGLGVYVVLQIPGVYFLNDLYIRLSDGEWEVAINFNGPWRIAKDKEIPFTLKKAKAKGHRGKGYGKNRKK